MMIKEIRAQKSNTIKLQFANGRYFAQGTSDREILQQLNCTQFDEKQSDIIFPRLVRLGYKIAITNNY